MSKQPVRARLLDALLSDVILPPLPARDVALDQEMVFHHNAALRPILSEAVCIEATNVARFFDENYMAKQDADAFWSDLKCLVPPHERFFVEWEDPRIPGVKRMGLMFAALRPEQADAWARAVIGNGAKNTPAKIAEFRSNVRCR